MLVCMETSRKKKQKWRFKVASLLCMHINEKANKSASPEIHQKGRAKYRNQTDDSPWTTLTSLRTVTRSTLGQWPRPAPASSRLCHLAAARGRLRWPLLNRRFLRGAPRLSLHASTDGRSITNSPQQVLQSDAPI